MKIFISCIFTCTNVLSILWLLHLTWCKNIIGKSRQMKLLYWCKQFNVLHTEVPESDGGVCVCNLYQMKKWKKPRNLALWLPHPAAAIPSVCMNRATICNGNWVSLLRLKRLSFISEVIWISDEGWQIGSKAKPGHLPMWLITQAPFKLNIGHTTSNESLITVSFANK